MTSVIPYDPDDDNIDNNPFAEPLPVEQQHEQPETSQQGEYTEEQQGQEQQQQEEEEQEQEQSQQPESISELDVLPERKDSKYKLVVKVTGLERVGSTTNKKDNPIIIFDISTNLPTFRKQQHRKVKKTTDEFRQLFKYLNGAIQESFIPSLPLSYTNYGINNNEDYNKTVQNFQAWFNRISEDPLVLRNEELAFFIESDFNTYSPINKSKLPASGLKRKTLKQLAPPYDEIVELAEFRPLVKSIHWISQDMQAKLSKVSKTRKILAQEENALGQGFAALEEEQNKLLYKKFGKIITAAGDIDSIIATLDNATLYDGLEWIVKDTYVVKEALTNRHLVMRELAQAQQNSKSKQEQARKLRAKRDINPLKVDEALRQLKAATKEEHDLTKKLQRISANMLIERKEWLSWYETCIANSVKGYILRKIEYERKKLTLLERIRSDVRRADTNGGLSRLGRESSISSMKKNEDISQGVNGDDWTGESRHRTKGQMDTLRHTEFDKSLTIVDSNPPPSEKNAAESASLDARNAASLLGLPTF